MESVFKPRDSEELGVLCFHWWSEWKNEWNGIKFQTTLYYREEII